MDPSEIAKQFTQFYYTTFDTDRSQLAPLYVRTSIERQQRDPGRSDDCTASSVNAHIRESPNSRSSQHHRETHRDYLLFILGPSLVLIMP